jgi:tetratricopeptide (TPR) repeat protein
MEQGPYDHELDGGGVAPSSAELAKVHNRNLVKWLEYVNSNPPLQILKEKIPQIMQALDYAGGIPETADNAAALMVAVDERFERLGLWKLWGKRLFHLYQDIVTHGSEPAKLDFFQCFMNYYLNRGDMLRATFAINAINALLELAEFDTPQKLQNAMLGAAAVAASLELSPDAIAQAEQIVSLALLTDNDVLLGRAYSVLSQFHANRRDPIRTYDYGLRVYSIGKPLGNDQLILSGLHLMALAFQLTEQPEFAFNYLERARDHASLTGNTGQIAYINLTWGACAYIAEDFETAEQYIRSSLEKFSDPDDHHITGNYHVSALYAHGLCLLRLGRYEEAESRFNTSLIEWGKLKRVRDQIYAKHALAELYSLRNDHQRAIKLMKEVLKEVKKMDGQWDEAFLIKLNNDLNTYTKRQDQGKTQ